MDINDLTDGFGPTGNPEIDDAVLEALKVGDVDGIERALDAVVREHRRRAIRAFVPIYQEQRQHLVLHAALAMWFERPEAQHEPRVSEGVKGDLTRWTVIDGLRLPTVRRDLVGDVQAGRIQYQGKELVCHLADNLSDASKKWLVGAFEVVEGKMKIEREALAEAQSIAFSTRPVTEGKTATHKSAHTG